MAGRGPAPKSSATRQRRNKKPGAVTLPPALPPAEQKPEVKEKPKKIPTIPNPDGRKWHKLTRAWWKHVWSSPMASEYLPTDSLGLGRLALLVDDFYSTLDPKLMTEIRLQEARFGLSPVDRSRLHWEIPKPKTEPPQSQPAGQVRKSASDPRGILGVVK